MPANTATNGLPYPLGTDPISDGDDAIKALAQALDPAWTALPLNTGLTARAGFAAPACRLVGTRKVELRGGIQKGSAFASSDLIGTLPAGMRPTVAAQVAIAGSRSTTPGAITWRLDIAATTGALTILVDQNPSNALTLDGVVFWLS